MKKGVSDVEKIHSLETFRARILRVGGWPPYIQFQVRSESPFVLSVSEEMARMAGAALDTEVDVTGDIVRRAAPGFPIVSGTVRKLAILSQLDPIAVMDAMDAWYAAMGRPWSGVTDIEAELERERG